jgi:GNAT superfamily N-acetyltransferase
MTVSEDIGTEGISKVKNPGSWAEAERVMDFFNRNSIKQDLHWFTHRDTIERAFSREDRRLYYFESADSVIAALMVWCESRVLEDQEAQIRQVAVAPSYRGIGYGTQLCGRAEQFASDFGKDVMVADAAADEPAVEFWLSMGYESEDSWETDSGREMVRFSKGL